MKLKRNIIFALLFGVGLPVYYSPVMATSVTENVQSVDQTIDEVKLKELKDFRKSINFLNLWRLRMN